MTIIFTVASGFVCKAVLKKSYRSEMQVSWFPELRNLLSF